MAQHRDPHFRPGRGETCGIIGLSPDAERAYTAWRLLYNERLAAIIAPGQKVARLDPEDLEAKLADERGTVRGELLQIAVVDAQARPVSAELAARPMTVEYAAWEVVQMLAEATATLTEVPVVDACAEDTCRHDVAYSDTCASCEEDDL